MVTTSCQAHTKANKKQGHQRCCVSVYVCVGFVYPCLCLPGLVHSFIWPGCAKSFIHSPTNIVHCSACVSAGTAPIEPFQDGFLDSNDWISLNGNPPRVCRTCNLLCEPPCEEEEESRGAAPRSGFDCQPAAAMYMECRRT